MRDRANGPGCPGAGVLMLIGLLLPAITAWSTESPPAESNARTFTLEEIPIQDCPAPIRSRLQTGQIADEFGNSPLRGVTYPALQSSKPIYGTFTFDRSLLDPQAGLRYSFAVDESRGTGTGYDRFYFDLNHDSDLTNDAAVAALKEAPAGMATGPKAVFFEKIQVRLDYGPGGVWTQVIMPQVRHIGDSGLVYFVAPTARKGKIALGAEEVELVLAQCSSIAGRYNRPMADVFFTGKQELIPIVGCWRKVNGTFYRLSPSPTGDKITVEAYAGPFGTFELGAGGRDLGPLSLDLSYLLSRNMIVDLAACEGAKGKWTVPVGDYRPFQLSVRYGQRRVGFRVEIPPAGQGTAPPAVFPFQIRQGESCILDFSDKPQVVFRSPDLGQRVKRGETVKIEAVLLVPATGTMIAALEDTTQKTTTVDLPDGRKLDMFASVAPKVKIVGSSGQILAEGDMPFG